MANRSHHFNHTAKKLASNREYEKRQDRKLLKGADRQKGRSHYVITNKDKMISLTTMKSGSVTIDQG